MIGSSSTTKTRGNFGMTASLCADYGAIAYSQSSDTYGYSYGYRTRAQAERAALQNCDCDDAEIVARAPSLTEPLRRSSG